MNHTRIEKGYPVSLTEISDNDWELVLMGLVEHLPTHAEVYSNAAIKIPNVDGEATREEVSYILKQIRDAQKEGKHTLLFSDNRISVKSGERAALLAQMEYKGQVSPDGEFIWHSLTTR